MKKIKISKIDIFDDYQKLEISEVFSISEIKFLSTVQFFKLEVLKTSKLEILTAIRNLNF